MMRLPRERLTVRRMMVGAAVATTLVAYVIGLLWRLSPEQVRLRDLANVYIAKAEHHAELERKFERLCESRDIYKSGHMTARRGGQIVHVPFPQRPELAREYRGLAAYHGSLKEKYRRAATSPQLPVAPDPLEPPEPE
jgi:hypothetical protein